MTTGAEPAPQPGTMNTAPAAQNRPETQVRCQDLATRNLARNDPKDRTGKARSKPVFHDTSSAPLCFAPASSTKRPAHPWPETVHWNSRRPPPTRINRYGNDSNFDSECRYVTPMTQNSGSYHADD